MTAAFRFALIPAFLLASLGAPAAAAPVTADAVESATYAGGTLPQGQAALTAKVQVLLDRAGVSPGVIDGIKGGMSRSAIAAFERRSGLPADGVMDARVWAALQTYAGEPIITDYTITAADETELTRYIPDDYLEKANMTTLGFTSVAEKLGERFHMDDDFIAVLNPGVPLVAGSRIKVVAPSKPLRAKLVRILIEKGTNRVAGFDATGHMVVNYPATIGSAATPSPSGTHKVRTVALNPEYTYNPAINFTQGENRSVLTLPPGPNGPVGTVWIALSKPTYGLHGTATPSRLFVNESYGCVRLTNWDAEELAHMVQPGITTVEFLEPGVTLADMFDESDAIRTATAAATEVAAPAAAGALSLASSTAPLRRPVGLSGTAAAVPEAATPAGVTDGVSAAAAAVTAPEPTATGAARMTPAPDGGLPSVAELGADGTPALTGSDPTQPGAGQQPPLDPLTAAVEEATSDAPDVDVTNPIVDREPQSPQPSDTPADPLPQATPQGGLTRQD
ncbi:Lipoprotein-anchoring transpeptidase ErfK/SrfK [Paracoccus isoporae]|uniref:Lipoprotein-anchoring transpeptidase ErfK/SrfK n=1 Tax=Paracoccus isoporae TaxID=591205 RepID=A0A1G7CYN1_9RHOB|nr:L,D-transpeptidase [Paracoccus isoporae]SDE43880.1 Lipoprotein-anchoring transpeptidase ErfK/SrfK [Paracoccus isoporae]